MHNFRYRPKDNFLKEASWDELLLLTKKWKSELTLHCHDLRYLNQELDTCFEKLLIHEDPIELPQLKKDIEIHVVQGSILLKHIPYLINQLTCMTQENPDLHSSPTVRYELELFEDDYSEYIETVKVLRLVILIMLNNLSQKTKSDVFWKMN